MAAEELDISIKATVPEEIKYKITNELGLTWREIKDNHPLILLRRLRQEHLLIPEDIICKTL